MNSDLYAPTRPLSKTAITQAHRAAKAIAAHFTAHNIPATEGTEPSEHLTEASYAAAEERHIYQSEAQYERWLDWRTLTESIVIDTLNARTATEKETTMQTKTHRPTIGNTVAVGRFSPNGPAGYAAVYNDGTHGPTRSTREEAERDYHIPPIETLQTMKDPAHAVRQSPEAQALINAAADDDPGEERESNCFCCEHCHKTYHNEEEDRERESVCIYCARDARESNY